MPQQTIWKRLQQLRLKQHMSQSDFANILWISRITYHQIEQWERELKQTEIIKLSETLEIDIDELLKPKPKKIRVWLTKDNDKNYKFKETLLYILNKCAQKPNVGKTVINKLLYFADFNYYEKNISTITNINYIKLPKGPVPENMDEILQEMEKYWDIKIVDINYHNYKQIKLIPTREPDLSVFSSKEIEEINNTIQKYSDWNAEKLSEWSHWDMPYKATEKVWDRILPQLATYRDMNYSVKMYDDEYED